MVSPKFSGLQNLPIFGEYLLKTAIGLGKTYVTPTAAGSSADYRAYYDEDFKRKFINKDKRRRVMKSLSLQQRNYFIDRIKGEVNKEITILEQIHATGIETVANKQYKSYLKETGLGKIFK